MPTNREINVVIIDDDEDDYFIIADYLGGIEGSRFKIDWCNNYELAKQKIGEKAYDIYFVDYRLGNRTGLELLKETIGSGFDDPIVLLTGKGNKDIDVKAMQFGATDYLIKSELNTEKLERCIRYSLERSASLKEIKARENKYRNLFENSKDAVFIADEQLILAELNQAACELFAAHASGLINRSFYDFIQDKGKRKILTELFERRDNIRDVEIDIENLEGELHSCLLSVSFLDNSSGEPLVYCILHDITNIKKAEIANLQAQKLSANERLMRVLAHEIRNPLNNISLSADQFDMTENDVDMQQSLVEIIKRNCIRINHIISELLDLTKPPELTFQEHNLQEIVNESIAMNSDRINLHKINVQKNYPDSPLQISANKSKLIIAFTNILINAIEAMETNKGMLTVSMTSTPEQYHVSIRDNGKGIPEEYLSKLFEPFFTLKKNGMGLGLASSYSIIQSHKAAMRVESKVDQGTNFIISFSRLN
ncbi:MAG TPA: ATP-binding protein [Chitinophagaceae bacterium]